MTSRLTISMDFELGWGAIETGLWRLRQFKGVYEELRPVLRDFCDFLEERQLALTWATVGAAIDEPRQRDFEHLPTDAQAAVLSFQKNADEKTTDARDLLDMLSGLKTCQDIGSHSYSHTRFNWPGYDAHARERDVRLSLECLRVRECDPVSFVYPLNIVDDHTVANRGGVKLVRLPPGVAGSRLGKLVERSVKAPPAARFDSPGGNLPAMETGSALFAWPVRPDAPLRRMLTNRHATLGLNAATKQDGHDLHIWLHPFNLVEVPHLAGDLRAFLSRAAEYRDAGRLRVATMADLLGD